MRKRERKLREIEISRERTKSLISAKHSLHAHHTPVTYLRDKRNYKVWLVIIMRDIAHNQR